MSCVSAAYTPSRRMVLRSHAGRIFVTALLTLVATVGIVAPASAAEKAIWGPVTLPNGSSAFGLYRELGIDTLQLTVSWSSVAPTRPGAPTNPADPAYRWPPEIAAAASEAARYGINLALLVSTAPAWANGGREPIWAPNNPQDFANFMTAAARRYPGVRRWMIWGEPNKAQRFQPNRENDPIGPRTYAPLLDASYAALKAANPGNIVIGGMTWTGDTVKPPDFVRWMRLSNGRPPRLDWYGHNPFPYRFPDLNNQPQGGFRDISDVDTLGREVDAAYGRAAGNPVPLWLSEYTIQSGRGSSTFGTFVSAHDQAKYVTAGFRLADDLGEGVAGIGWFSLLDEPVAPGSANWGVLTHSLQRKESFGALYRARSERRRPKVKAPPRIRRSRFARRGITVRVTPRINGRLTVELRRRGQLLEPFFRRGVSGKRRTIRLRRPAAGKGAYSVWVRSARGSTVRVNFRVY